MPGNLPDWSSANLETLQPLAVALAIGLVIGVERGWRLREGAEGSRVAGLRTFGLIGLAGGITGTLAEGFGGYVYGFGFLGFCILILGAYWQEVKAEGGVSLTSSVAALVTFGLGALAASGATTAAAAAAVVSALLLGLKPVLHGWLKHIEERELLAALELLLISVVILPVLPDRGFGPFEALNPYRLWLMVVLIAGLSFAGYVAVRLVGSQRGLALTALFGGLVSSTAVALSFARRSRASGELDGPLSAGIVIASSIMLGRVAVLLALIEPSLLTRLAWPLGAMAALGAAAAFILSRRQRNEKGSESPVFANPFELGTALQLALLLAIVILASRAMQDWFGESGLLAVGAAAGLTDVDAITVSTGQFVAAGLEPSTGALVILLAVITNTAVKGALALTLGSRPLARSVGASLALMIGVGLAAYFLAAQVISLP